MKLQNVFRKVVAAVPLAASSLVVWTGSAHAADLKTLLQSGATNTAQGAGISQQADLTTSIGKIINGAFGLLGTVFVVLMIYAGFLYMTAQGNEEQVEKAKTLIKNAVIGLVIMFLAYAITNFVIGAVTQ
ncbi:MAG: pilin [Patescibacteria group bacterium]